MYTFSIDSSPYSIDTSLYVNTPILLLYLHYNMSSHDTVIILTLYVITPTTTVPPITIKLELLVILLPLEGVV